MVTFCSQDSRWTFLSCNLWFVGHVLERSSVFSVEHHSPWNMFLGILSGHIWYIIAWLCMLLRSNPQLWGSASSHSCLCLDSHNDEGMLNVQLLPSLRHPAHSSGCPVGLAQHHDIIYASLGLLLLQEVKWYPDGVKRVMHFLHTVYYWGKNKYWGHCGLVCLIGCSYLPV